jgi:hypothetical protein
MYLLRLNRYNEVARPLILLIHVLGSLTQVADAARLQLGSNEVSVVHQSHTSFSGDALARVPLQDDVNRPVGIKLSAYLKERA